MEKIKELKIEAKLENIETAIRFINTLLEEHGCRVDIMQRIDLALEEMLVNVSQYAYEGITGDAYVSVSFPEETLVQLDIRDKGVPYDPTKKEDPDVSIPLRQRKKGGLGIYMTKMVMDEMCYERKDGYNHTILRKNLPKDSSTYSET